MLGRCVSSGVADAGVDAGGLRDVSIPFDTGTTTDTGAPPRDTGVTARDTGVVVRDAGNAPDARETFVAEQPGCACRAGEGARGRSQRDGWVALAALGVAVRRRRRGL